MIHVRGSPSPAPLLPRRFGQAGELKNRAMRICLDCTPLLGPSAGVKTYLWYLNRHLRSLPGAQQVLSFPLPLNGRSFLNQGSQLNHEGSVFGPHATTAYSVLARSFSLERSPLPSLLGTWVDVFHASNLARHPPSNTCLTATMFDATCWRMPEMHTSATVRNEMVFAERILQHARGVIAISESTRRDAVEYLGLDPDRVVTIYPGVADAYFESIEPETLSGLRRKYRLPERYILFVGTIEPRKNVDRLLDAYLQLPAPLRDEVPLLLAGMEGWASELTIARLRSLSPQVRYLGYVPELELHALTAGAEVLAYPSLYEGFGLPVAQAMAAGVPVITSPCGALAEVTGGAALLVDPLSPGEIAAALARILTSASLRQELTRRGRNRAQRFRWQVSAPRVLNFFEEVAGKGLPAGMAASLTTSA